MVFVVSKQVCGRSFAVYLRRGKKEEGREKEGEVCGSFVIVAASHDCWKQDSTFC